MLYGINDTISVPDRVLESVQGFWPGLTDDKLGYGHDDAHNKAMTIAVMASMPIFTLLANYDNDERAAMALHPDGTVVTQLLNKDTLSEEWSEFIDKQSEQYL